MPGYTFKHALVQDAAYGTLLRERRRQLHARIAAALEDRFPAISTTQPALVAHHCTEAGLAEKAVAYWLAAGRQAWGRSAVAEAVGLLRRGLALVPALPDGDPRHETELDLLIALGQALIANKGWGAPDLDEVHSRALTLASALKRPRALLSAVWGQYAYYAVSARHERARQLAAAIRDLGETSGDIPTRVIGYDACAFTSNCLGEFTAGQAYVEKGLALYDPAHRLFYSELMTNDRLVLLLDHSTLPLACLGYLDQARSRADAALAEARRLSHPYTLVDALAWDFWTGWCIGSDPKSLAQCADEILALADEHGLGLFRAGIGVCRGWCLAALGHVDEGIPVLTTGLAAAHESGFMAHTTTFLTMLADAGRMAGQWQAALGHLGEAQRWAEKTGDRWALAEAHRLRGDVLLGMGDPTAAEAGYREAIAVAKKQSAKLWELRAATSLARLWRDQGQRTEARDLLAPVYGWFTEGFAMKDLREAKVLLEVLA
jgi:predicted ATPase